ncbi:unknown [Clostridium sp. CAG:762]|nr:unknown [Clostridium sp. CAG:762]
MNMWKKIVIGIVLLFALFFCLLCFVVGNYDGDLINEVSNKTKIKDIVYVNKNNYHYVVLTNDKVYVFDDKYKLVLEKERGNINYNKYDIVYKRNMLMYEEESMNTYYLVYSYYDIEDGKLINEVEIRR